jgi:hypothetical protein
MADVFSQYSNLWFASQKKIGRWLSSTSTKHADAPNGCRELTQRPRRPTETPSTLKVSLTLFDSSTMENLKKTVANKDSAGFAAAYNNDARAVL